LVREQAGETDADFEINFLARIDRQRLFGVGLVRSLPCSFDV